jgi:hypothetical protein
LQAGIYQPERFAEVTLSAATRDLLRRNPRHGVDLVDLGRLLLEDAYPGGIARRPGYPDIKAYYADRMALLIRRKTKLALRSHRRVDWLMQAFRGPPQGLMRALRDRGFIDIEHPGRSRLFEQTEFGGPMFRVFDDEEKSIIVDWIESLRPDDAGTGRSELVTAADPSIDVPEQRVSHEARFPPDEAQLLVAGNGPERPLPGRRRQVGVGAVH